MACPVLMNLHTISVQHKVVAPNADVTDEYQRMIAIAPLNPIGVDKHSLRSVLPRFGIGALRHRQISCKLSEDQKSYQSDSVPHSVPTLLERVVG